MEKEGPLKIKGTLESVLKVAVTKAVKPKGKNGRKRKATKGSKP